MHKSERKRQGNNEVSVSGGCFGSSLLFKFNTVVCRDQPADQYWSLAGVTFVFSMVSVGTGLQ